MYLARNSISGEAQQHSSGSSYTRNHSRFLDNGGGSSSWFEAIRTFVELVRTQHQHHSSETSYARNHSRFLDNGGGSWFELRTYFPKVIFLVGYFGYYTLLYAVICRDMLLLLYCQPEQTKNLNSPS